MSCYSHLTIEERESLMLFHEQGKSIRQIALALHRAASTISRELRRNPGPYRASAAQKNYHHNRRRCVRTTILSNLSLHRDIHFFLGYLYWSPEEIANRMRMEATAKVSAGTIYRALESGLLQDTLRPYLQIKYRKHGKNKEPNKKCFQRSIIERPEEVLHRTEAGHWEGDTVRGSNETDALVTLVDRYSRFLLCMKVPNKESGTVRKAVVKLLRECRLPVRSVTFDQGSEFTESEGMEQDLGVPVYYAHPSSPWERPTNENTNGLIRQFVPKRSKVSSLTDEDVSRMVSRLNFRPRKCLDWKTPYEVAFEQVLHLT